MTSSGSSLKCKNLPGLEALSRLPMWSGSSFSPIEVPRKILEVLGNPQNAISSIHVAGTNGKGSVSAGIASCLHAAGYQVGQFVSPHLSSVTERCLLNGVPVSEEEYDSAVAEVLEAVQEIKEKPSFFVVTMAAAFLVFRSRQLDFTVVEVGLGGSFDATNTISRPEVSVVTRVGIDHQHWLGGSLEEIAANKAGIIKSGVPVLVGMNEIVVTEVCRNEAQAKGAPFFAFGEEFNLSKDQSKLDWSEGSFEFPPELLEERGTYAHENRALVVRAAIQLGLSQHQVARGLAQVRWPGRFELIEGSLADAREIAPDASQPLRVLLDGAHNPQAIEAFATRLQNFLSRNPQFTRLAVVISIRNSKDVLTMCELFSSALKKQCKELHWYTTAGSITLAADPKELAVLFTPSEAIDDPEQALSRALTDSDQNTLTIVTGSLYLIGKLRPLLSEGAFTAIATT